MDEISINYAPKKHMAMLQFSMKNYLLDKSYTAITIDIKNSIIKFAQINNYDREAIIRTIIIDNEDIGNLLDIVELKNFEKFEKLPLSEFDGYYHDGKYICYVLFSADGIYSAGAHACCFIDEDPVKKALTWACKRYDLRDIERILC